MTTTDTSQQKTVRSESAEYRASAAYWHKVRALMGGTHAMRQQGKIYLPQEPGEPDPNYMNRLNRTTLFNGFRKTVHDMAGKIFAKPIAIGDDMPEDLKDYAENVDLAGRNLGVFAFDITKDALQTGISFILGEMPPALPEGSTRADEIQQGRRPYLVHIKAEDLIGWKSDLVNGQETILQARIVEEVKEPDPENEFEDICVEQVRVLEPGRWATYRKVKGDDNQEKWALHEEGTTTLKYVPLAPVYFNRTGFLTGKPPLEDLADLNIAHWQSQSDQRNILHVARVPILFGAGFDEKASVVIGSGTMVRSSDPSASLTYVEHSGNAIGSGKDDLESLQAQMQVMGLQLLISKPGQTATGELRDDSKENSPLAMMAHALQDALEAAFGFMADYAGIGADSAGSLIVNTDFSIASRGAEDQQTLLASAQNGLITHETFIRELQRRGVLADDLDVEDEVEKLSLLDMEDDTTDPSGNGNGGDHAALRGPGLMSGASAK